MMKDHEPTEADYLHMEHALNLRRLVRTGVGLDMGSRRHKIGYGVYSPGAVACKGLSDSQPLTQGGGFDRGPRPDPVTLRIPRADAEALQGFLQQVLPSSTEPSLVTLAMALIRANEQSQADSQGGHKLGGYDAIGGA